LSNPDGIANLSDIRDRAPTLAAAAKSQESPENSNYAAASAANGGAIAIPHLTWLPHQTLFRLK
jgi:hypothetical protein